MDRIGQRGILYGIYRNWLLCKKVYLQPKSFGIYIWNACCGAVLRGCAGLGTCCHYFCACDGGSGGAGVETCTVTLEGVNDVGCMLLIYSDENGSCRYYEDEGGFGSTVYPSSFTVKKNSFIILKNGYDITVSVVDAEKIYSGPDSIFIIDIIYITGNNPVISMAF